MIYKYKKEIMNICLSLQAIGLLLDIIGVILLFSFKPPGKWGIMTRKTKEENRKILINKIGTWVGLSFIILGFLLQFIPVLIPSITFCHIIYI